MLVKSSFILAASLLALACSDNAKDQSASLGGAGGGSAGAPAASAGTSGAGVTPSAGAAGSGVIGGEQLVVSDDDALVVPQTVRVAPLAGGNGVLNAVALTLVQGPTNPELYIAVKNVGAIPACSPAFSVQLFDKDEQSLATSIGGLLVSHFYRRTDDPSSIASCVSPGDVSMIALTDLDPALVIEQVDHIVYFCNYWNLGVEPIGGISFSGVESVASGSGVAYSGVLKNEFDVPLANPSVDVFPTTHVGRPLGVAHSSGTEAVPPGGTWSFQTDDLAEAGADQAVYPASGP